MIRSTHLVSATERRAAISLLVGFVVACSGPTELDPASGGTGGKPSSVGGSAGSPSMGGASAGSGAGAPGAGGAATGDSPWCGALAVIRENCQGCHGITPQFTAPMSLVTIDDLRAPSKTDPSKPVYQAVAERIADAQRPMPPLSSGDPLTAAEKAAITDWIAGGAEASTDTICNEGSGGAGGTGGAAPVWPPPDCEERYQLVAHGKSAPNDTTKFDVSAAGTGKQWYQCFFFKAPWGTDEVQVVGFRPIIDNPDVVHHWILYGNENGTQSDGQVGGTGCGTGAFLQGWAPGGRGTHLPADVGLQMPSGPNVVLGLEIHYNNEAGLTNALDASGVELCTTKKFRPNTAAVHWLGTMLLSIPARQTASFSNTCKPTGSQPVNILSISPHMHQLGSHAKVILNRANGTKETLIDQPFDFADQYAIPVRTVVNPGDTLTSTCTYDNMTTGNVRFGPNTDDEMCFFFTTAYPVGELIMGLPIQPNRCIDGL